ncbi:peptide chain release factor 1-like, mitochondrial [Patella vulgata]|uniref:peptide chain release factor 1-like, mitochondrial n=1 Tax=Patella vulgata TaxID=6465 RepID=UPI00218006AC|nr:peptide chain release factor 1-like, mitochondrial [Patella vulgata]
MRMQLCQTLNNVTLKTFINHYQRLERKTFSVMNYNYFKFKKRTFNFLEGTNIHPTNKNLEKITGQFKINYCENYIPPRINVRKYATKSVRDRFTYTNPKYASYLSSIEEEMKTLSEDNTNNLSKSDHKRLREITPAVELIKELKMKVAELQELSAFENKTQDQEMENMILDEKKECSDKIQEIENQLVDVLCEEERIDNNDIILEVTAGVGGQEAMLFTAEVFNMYMNYVTFKGWSQEILGYEISDQGGIRRASMEIKGTNVFKHLKYEGGVHRVQRVPQTERSGRIHTSTMAVAILPQPTEIDVVLHSKDLKIETFRATGAGGQSVNKTDSAVRVIHIPTGIVSECQEERFQVRNKDKAIKVLRSRIYQKELEAQMSEQKALRKFQMGSGGRSEKIRTYNFKENRITDHRIHQNIFSKEFLSGGQDLDDLIQTLWTESKYLSLEAMLDDYCESIKMREKKKNS